MNIVIDARWIFPEISGIGAYTRELLRQLGQVDQHNHYTLLFRDAALRDRTLEETGLAGHPRFDAALFPHGLFSLSNQLLLGGWLRRRNADCFHSPNYMIPLPPFSRRRPQRCRCVVTIHDVIPMIFPNHAPRSRKARLYPIYRRLMRAIGNRADRIITDSHASARDVAHHLGLVAEAQERIQTIYCGVDARFTPGPPVPPPGPDAERRLLYVGRSDPYKNVDLLVRAFATARATLRFPLRLTIAGSPDPRYPEAQATARRLGVADVVRWTGYLPDGELLALYRTSSALVHPSRYEGFGLQILEAMACGLPVICGNGGSLPEVAGDAAIVLDSDDEAGFARSIVDLLTHPQQAADLRARGLQRAAGFTWEQTARQTLAVFSSLAPDPTAGVTRV